MCVRKPIIAIHQFWFPVPPSTKFEQIKHRQNSGSHHLFKRVIGRRQVLLALGCCLNRQQEILFQHGDQQAVRTTKRMRRHLPTKEKDRGRCTFFCNVVFMVISSRRIFDGNNYHEERRADGGGGGGLVALQEQQLPVTSPFQAPFHVRLQQVEEMVEQVGEQQQGRAFRRNLYYSWQSATYTTLGNSTVVTALLEQ
jgi:hypothetical protein